MVIYNKKKGMLPRLILPLAVVFALLISGSAVYGATPGAISGGELQITGYTIIKGDNANYTGAINKGDRISLSLGIYDSRAFLAAYSAANPPAPGARLNADAFSVDNQGDIQLTNLAPAASGIGWTYTLVFNNMMYTGTEKLFRAEIFYAGADVPLSVYEQTIHQCVEYVAPADPAAPTVKGTGFVLKSSGYGDATIYAGQAFTLNLNWVATNGAHNVENVTVGIAPANELALKDGSSLVYIGTVGPGGNVTASYSLLPGANINEGSYSVIVDIKGVDASTGNDVTAQATISVPILQPERFEIFKTELPTDLYAGMNDGLGYGSITLVNRGKGAVANVTAEISGKGLTTEEGSQYLGHIAGGEQKSADFNISASETGNIAAQVIISYENARGEHLKLTKDFTVNVQESIPEEGEGEMELPPDVPIEGAGGAVPFWIWIVAGLVVVAAAAIITALLIKKSKARKAAELELDDSYDEGGEGDASSGGESS